MPARVDAARDDLVFLTPDNPRETSSQLHDHLRRLINDGNRAGYRIEPG
jgi:hypothetical protein